MDIKLGTSDAAIVWRDEGDGKGKFIFSYPKLEVDRQGLVPESVLYLAAVLVIPSKYPDLYQMIVNIIASDDDEGIDEVSLQ